MEINRIVIHCKCGMKLFDDLAPKYPAGNNLMLIVPPCPNCAAQQQRAADGAYCACSKDMPRQFKNAEVCEYCGKPRR